MGPDKYSGEKSNFYEPEKYSGEKSNFYEPDKYSGEKSNFYEPDKYSGEKSNFFMQPLMLRKIEYSQYIILHTMCTLQTNQSINQSMYI
jgi:hypothetical protein